MFNKTELNEKLTAELRELAKAQGILNADELRKAELVEIIAQIKEQDEVPVLTEAEPVAQKITKPRLSKVSTGEKPARKRARIAPKEEMDNGTIK